VLFHGCPPLERMDRLYYTSQLQFRRLAAEGRSLGQRMSYARRLRVRMVTHVR
jgi:hypothetical protein